MAKIAHAAQLLVSGVLAAATITVFVAAGELTGRVSLAAALPVAVVLIFLATHFAVKCSDFYRRGRGNRVGPAAGIPRDFLGVCGYGGPAFEHSAPRAVRRLGKLGRKGSINGSLRDTADGLRFVPSPTWRRLGVQPLALDLTAWSFVPEPLKWRALLRWAFDSTDVDLVATNGATIRLGVRDVDWAGAMLSGSISGD